MTAKIGLHVIVPSGVDASIYTAAPWAALLAVDDSSTLKQAAAAGIPMRIYRSTTTDGASPSDAANALLDQDWSATTHLVLATESDNANNPDWQAQTIRALRGRGWTRGILCGAWATGNPAAYDMTTHADHTPHFPALLPWAPVFAACDGLALDEYMASLPGDAVWPDQLYWVGSRHRLYAHCLAQHGIPVPRMIVKESGLDRVWPGATRIGRTGVTAAQYAALAAALDAEDQRDGYIAARLYFTLGPTPDWRAFAYDDALPAMAAYVTAQKGPPVLKFLDMSKYQTITDWSLVAANYQGVLIQATYGSTGVDDTFADKWAQAKAHGLKRVAYHYSYGQYNAPVAEANNFLKGVGLLASGDGAALDLEEPMPDPAAWASAWLQIVQQATGAPRILYSGYDYLQSNGVTAAGTGNPFLWLADYRDTEPPPPAGWADITIWQHTSNAIVPGIEGPVDEDYVYLTEEQFAALCIPQEVPTVDPLTQLALNRARAANPAIMPNVAGLGFQTYRSMVAVWDEKGRPNYLDAGPWLRDEAATATDSYIPLDNGAIIHCTNRSGQWVAYLAEAKERAAIFAACGWGAPD